MKNLFFLLMGIFIMMSGCSSNKLSGETAMKIITQELDYPKTLNYDIFCSDPVYARKMIDAGLEEKGLVTVARTQKLKDIGDPLIRFTDEAKAYFLPTPEEDKASDIQKVKLASEELTGIIDIAISDDNKHAIVRYTTSYKNITPFSVLSGQDFDKEGSHKAYFLYSDNSWRIVKKPGPEFMIGD